MIPTPQPQPPADLRRAVAHNLLTLGAAPEGWDAAALGMLRDAAPTVARAGVYPIAEQVRLAMGRAS